MKIFTLAFIFCVVGIKVNVKNFIWYIRWESICEICVIIFQDWKIKTADLASLSWNQMAYSKANCHTGIFERIWNNSLVRKKKTIYSLKYSVQYVTFELANFFSRACDFLLKLIFWNFLIKIDFISCTNYDLHTKVKWKHNNLYNMQ